MLVRKREESTEGGSEEPQVLHSSVKRTKAEKGRKKVEKMERNDEGKNEIEEGEEERALEGIRIKRESEY